MDIPVDRMNLIWALLLFAVIISPGRAVVSEDARVVDGDRILAMIEKGESIDLSRVIINGDLDLGKLDLSRKRTVQSYLNIRNSLIYGNVTFDDLIMREHVGFENTRFFGFVDFSRTTFDKDVDFSESQFGSMALFKHAQFNGSVTFRKALFNRSVNFYKSTFNVEPLIFEGAQFIGPADFVETDFNVEEANFGWTKFDGPASFWAARFIGLANFQGSEFNGSADLTRTQFFETADFIGARFNKELYFNQVKFTSIEVTWDSFRENLVSNGPMFIALIKNFREIEQFEDADNCYYEYRNWKRDQRPLGWPKLVDYLAWLSCGYGVRWQYAILSGILMILLFGIYFELYNILSIIFNLYCGENSEKPLRRDYIQDLKKAVFFSAMTLLSLPDGWSPFGRDEYINFIKNHLYSSILERIIGWGLMLLLIGTISRLMIRY